MTAQIKPITWWNLPHLAFRTARVNWRYYRPKRRRLSLRRLGCSVVPNLARPVFVVGAPRTGTTFLGSCLGGLPEISYHFEPIATKAAARYVYEGLWTQRKARRFYRRVYAWLMRIHLDGDLVFAEKTPRNAFIIPFLLRCFPDARFIHIIRDGRDAALSLSKRPWLQASQEASGRYEPGGFAYGPSTRFWVEPERRREFETTSDIHRCIWSWRRHTEAALDAPAHLPAAQYHELRYEALVTDHRRVAEPLLDFLGIANPASRDLLFEAVARAKGDSVGRWQNELSEEQIERIKAEAGPLLTRLGYLTALSVSV